MKKVITCLSIGLLCASLTAQQNEAMVSENIVPNPGFEQFASAPIGWFYKGDHFTQVMKYWNSATSASPDVFGPKVRVPAYWKEKGFGQQKAHSGNSMVGVTAYGCEKGKPHCREYIQIQLLEPLVIGQNYSAEFWVSQLPLALRIDQLGLYLSVAPINKIGDGVLDFAPQVKAEDIIITPNNGWIKISGRFVAETAAEYLTIGNFTTDSLTTVQSPYSNHLNYAYYYVDDVSIKKEEPILEVPVLEDDLSRIPLRQGQLITLRNIFFDHDKIELLPRSFKELNKLVQLLRQHPTMIIKIIGHTDSIGDFDYNLELSERRAKAVIDYLREKGIPNDQALYKGYGSSQPIASNEEASGRQLNRRVELLIIKK